jgi:HK97 gp10 family phage protein
VSVSANVDISQVLKSFRNLPRTTQNRAMRPAMRKGAQVVLEAAKGNILEVTSNEATGLLSRSLRVYNFRKYKGMLRTAVMIRRGLFSNRGTRVGLYGSVLEYGKANQPPRSWIRRAVRTAYGNAVQAVLAEAAVRMDAAVKEARK